MNLKYQLRCVLRSLNYLIDHIPSQIFKTILSTSPKKMKHLLVLLQQKYKEIK